MLHGGLGAAGARLALVAGLLLLGGCQFGPGLPLLSPLAVAHNFGYSDAPLGGDRYSVAYLTPTRVTSSFGGPDPVDANAARTLGFDMVLWRAAQIAEAQGYPGFRVTERRSDVNSYPDPYYYDDPLSWDPYWAYRRPFGRPPFAEPPRTYMQAQVSIDVTLQRDLQSGDYAAADTIEQLRRTYPGADSVLPPGH
jgi:hypothetical protein